MGEIVPLIVAIVIGIIYNFFKGMSEKEGEKRKPTIPPKLDPMHPQHFGESKPRTAEPKKAVQTDSVVEIFTEKKQQQIQTKIDAITWVGVELNGTTFHFQVVEKNEPDKVEYYNPRHLVAKKKAVISKMFVEEGQPMVTINDYVKKGDLLVSGFIGQEGKVEVVFSNHTPKLVNIF